MELWYEPVLHQEQPISGFAPACHKFNRFISCTAKSQALAVSAI
jgi:hypothetical protein